MLKKIVALTSQVTQKPRPPLEETIQMLSRPQNQLYEERERARLERELRAVEECTFKPKLCKGTEKRVKEKVRQQIGEVDSFPR